MKTKNFRKSYNAILETIEYRTRTRIVDLNYLDLYTSIDIGFDRDYKFDIIHVEKCEKLKKKLLNVSPFRDENVMNLIIQGL